MDRTTLKALRESIAHWRRLYLGKARAGGAPHGSDCALCEAFLYKNSNCKGCPVYAKTRKGLCAGSPYSKARIAYDKYGKRSQQFKEKAWDMLEFLQSCLPAEATEKSSDLLYSQVTKNCATISNILTSLQKLLDATHNIPGVTLDDEGKLEDFSNELEIIKESIDDIPDNYKPVPAPRKIKRSVPWQQ